MWSYVSARNRDLRVRSVVERSMREGLGSKEVDLRPALTDFAAVEAPREDLTSIQSPEADLISPSEGFALTMAETLSLGGSDGRGYVEALGSPMGSSVLSDGGGLELLVADLPEQSSVISVFGGAPEMKIIDGEVLLEVAEGFDLVLSAPCFAMSFPSSSRFDGLQGDATEVRGRRDEVGQSPVVSAISALDGDQVMGDVGDATFSGRLGMGLAANFSDDRLLPGYSASPFAVNGLDSVCPSPIDDAVGSESWVLSVIEHGDGGDGGLLVVQGGDGGAAMVLPTEPVGSSLPCLPSFSVSDVATIDDGFVRVEVRVPPTARGALRPQPTDGLWQPPSSPVEPVSERVEKDMGTHGGASVSQQVLGGVATRPAPPGQPGETESAHDGVLTPGLVFFTTIRLSSNWQFSHYLFWVLSRACRRQRVTRGFSGGGLAPPASPHQLNALVGCTLTDPRRHRFFVDDCWRDLQAVHPRLVWSFDSARNRQIRVRDIVESTTKEEINPIKLSLGPDLRSSTEEVILTEDLRLMGSSSTNDFTAIASALKFRFAVEGELEEGSSMSSSPLSLSGAQFGPVNGGVVSVVAGGASIEPPRPAVDAR
ncbi:hypothetical protein Dimus_005588 [Dionaea muscipula]